MLLSSVSTALTEAGWSGSVAVGIRHTQEGATGVVATVDGLSVIPPGMRLPEGVTPLSDLLPLTPESVHLLGSTDVAGKLRAAPDLRFSAVAVTGTGESELPGVHQSSELTDWLTSVVRLAPAATYLPGVGQRMPPTIAARVLWAAESDDPEGAESEAGQHLRSLRWSGGQPIGYVEGLVTWLIAAAATSESGDGGQRGWYAQQVEHLAKLLVNTDDDDGGSGE